jgi:UDP-N-acetylmuramyl pentapeptide phosphotransferase/UDP-N-acetylglucosamine-1-phosphate transferase
MTYIPAAFAFLVAAAGWFYVLHASRARHLLGFEEERDNNLRIRLRRICGGTMMVLALAFYLGYVLAERQAKPIWVLLCLLLVMLLLPVILFLAWVDLRLTRKMRESLKQRKKP